MTKRNLPNVIQTRDSVFVYQCFKCRVESATGACSSIDTHQERTADACGMEGEWHSGFQLRQATQSQRRIKRI